MNHYLNFFIFSLLLSSSYARIQEFCVADLSQPESPAGFKCKDPASVTSNDFIYSFSTALAVNISYKVTLKPAFVDQYPILNGMGLSIASFKIGVGGYLPVHNHPLADELLVVVSGSLRIGLISSDNTAYTYNMKDGDVVAFPQGLLHYLINSGSTDVGGYAIYGNARAGFQITAPSLFGNDLPTADLAKVTFISPIEIKRLKSLFGWN